MAHIHARKMRCVSLGILMALLFGLFANAAFAQIPDLSILDLDDPPAGPNYESMASRTEGDASAIYCWPSWKKFSIIGCVLKSVLFLTYMALELVSWLFEIVGQFFDIIVSIQNQAFQNQPFVETGWVISRDVANIFYIFMLLFIAIGTILRIDSFNWKNLLPRLIISALLINFSLALASLIVDFSNVLGNTFYNNMGTTQTIPGTSIQVHDISRILTQGFSPAKIFQVGGKKGDAMGTLLEKYIPWDMAINMWISMVAGIILIMLAIFVFISAAVLLLFRIVVIWVLLALSPLAFLFAALPQTRGYFDKWLQTLLNQSFFYPAFMFMIYIAIATINSNAINRLLSVQGNEALFPSNYYEQGLSAITEKANVMLSYVFIGVLLMLSLVVAKQMGAYGTSMATSFAKGTMRRGGGYLNRAVAPISSAALRATSATTKAPVVGAMVRPFARALSAPLAASVRLAEKDREAARKSQAALARDLPPKAAAQMARTLNAKAKEELWKGMDDKKRSEFVKEMGEVDQINFAKAIHAVDPSKKYERQVAVASRNIATAMKILGHEGKDDREYQREVDNFLIKLDDKEKKDFMEADAVRENKYIQNHIINNFSISDVGKAADSTERAEAFGELLETSLNSGALSATNNKKLYDRLRTAPAGVMLIERLKEGRALRPSDYAQERQKRKEKGLEDDGKKKPEGGGEATKEASSRIITPSEGFGGGPRTQAEQAERERIRRELEENK